MSEKRGYNTRDAAAYIGVSGYTLKLSRCNAPRNATRSFVPPPHIVKEGGRILYLVEDLDAWLEERKVRPSPRRRA